MKFNQFYSFFSTFLITFPFFQTSLLASDVLIVQNDFDKLETISKKKINKEGKLVIKFCDKLKNYTGYVEVDNKKLFIENADLIKPKKIIWKNTNLGITKGNAINTDNLLARYNDEDSQEPLKILDNGRCGIGILPLLVIGAGIAVGAGGSGGSGGSGSSSSN